MGTKNILIIKYGAIGDVVRTTPLLRVLVGNVYWVTKPESIPLLPELESFVKISNTQNTNFLKSIEFDLVLCMDDEIEPVNLGSSVKSKRLVGSYIGENGEITYSQNSAEWFDMGLLSKHGKKTADDIKLKNKKTYQEILFKMLELNFNGEEYIINDNFESAQKNNSKIRIGIEKTAGSRWPMKTWNQYDKLAEQLNAENYEPFFFKYRENILDYVSDLNSCDIIVSGDTLGMHIALSLKKKLIALFICTSPTEIYDYGRLIKIESPFLEKVFYRKDYVPEAVEAIKFDQVYDAVKLQLGKVKRDK